VIPASSPPLQEDCSIRPMSALAAPETEASSFLCYVEAVLSGTRTLVDIGDRTMHFAGESRLRIASDGSRWSVTSPVYL
jgi:hypothetical protein